MDFLDDLNLAAESAIIWGNDTALFRNSAYNLRTEQNFGIGQNLTVAGTATITGATTVAAPTFGSHAATKTYVDTTNDNRLRYYAKRTSASPTSTGAEVGILRLDNVMLQAGRAYNIYTSDFLYDGTVSGDTAYARLRFSTTGTAVTTSTDLAAHQGPSMTVGSFQASGYITRTYMPAADVTMSILLTIGRAGGTGAVALVYVSAFAIEIFVEDIGAAVAATGVSL